MVFPDSNEKKSSFLIMWLTNGEDNADFEWCSDLQDLLDRKKD